jgi:hypothetical protein
MADDTGFPWGQAEERLAARIDTSVPHSARAWNYWLGGRDYYPVDKEAGDECAARFPLMGDTVRCLRYFTSRVVHYLAAEEGVRQFLDLGCGLPFDDPVHEIAQRAAPGSRVVYADNDPLVLVHARALLTGTGGTVGHLGADVADPATLLERAGALLDFSQPVAILLVAVLGHVGEADGEAARQVADTLKDALPAGGYLAVADLSAHPALDEAMSCYNATGAVPYHLRGPQQVRRLLDGLEVAPPGVVPVSQWRPEHSPVPAPDVPAWGGAGRKARP